MRVGEVLCGACGRMVEIQKVGNTYRSVCKCGRSIRARNPDMVIDYMRKKSSYELKVLGFNELDRWHVLFISAEVMIVVTNDNEVIRTELHAGGEQIPLGGVDTFDKLRKLIDALKGEG